MPPGSSVGSTSSTNDTKVVWSVAYLDWVSRRRRFSFLIVAASSSGFDAPSALVSPSYWCRRAGVRSRTQLMMQPTQKETHTTEREGLYIQCLLVQPLSHDARDKQRCSAAP